MFRSGNRDELNAADADALQFGYRNVKALSRRR
jgi:hypothetical protein